MSDNDPVKLLLSKLHTSSDTISDAYHQRRIHKEDGNARDIERLRQLRLLSPDVRDAFQLRASFRQFLNITLNTEKLFSMGANIGAYFQRLVKLIDEHSIAYQEDREDDCERYECETREAISDIADAIDDELLILQAQVETKFAAVSTIAEKRRQNLHYQQRTQALVNILGNLHFSDIEDQLRGHDELYLSFRSLLSNRLPAFREALLSILKLMNEYLFEFRQIEQRTRRIKAFALHLNRHADWEPKAWDEEASPQEWLQCAAPISIQSYPDIDDQASQPFLIDLALTIPGAAGIKVRNHKPAGFIEEGPTFVKQEIPNPPIRKAIKAYFKAGMKSDKGLSARQWWLANPSLLSDVREDLWLLRVLLEHDNKGKSGGWTLKTDHREHKIFDGNILIRDVFLSKGQAHA